jgi:hypothetical protein
VHLEDLRSALLTSEPVIAKQIGGGGGRGGKGDEEEKEGGMGGGKDKDKNKDKFKGKKFSNAGLKSQNDPKSPGVPDEEECNTGSCLGELLDCGETAAKVCFRLVFLFVLLKLSLIHASLFRF